MYTYTVTLVLNTTVSIALTSTVVPGYFNHFNYHSCHTNKYISIYALMLNNSFIHIYLSLSQTWTCSNRYTLFSGQVPRSVERRIGFGRSWQ